MARHLVRGAILLSITSALSCQFDRTRECANATDCALDGVDGQCVPAPSGRAWCAFLDGTCGVDGLRYGPLSGDGLAGSCVEVERRTLTTIIVGMGTVASDEPGIDCGDDCVEDYPIGTDVTLTATAASGWTFVGWSGDCTGREPCSLTMDAPHQVTATFEEGYELTVEIVGDGRGRIVANPRVLNCPPDCTYVLPAGQPVDVFAVPAAGSRFDGWSGDCTGATCEVTMNGPRSVTATMSDIVEWVRTAGDVNVDVAAAVTVDSSNIIVVGSFRGSIDFGGPTLTSDGGSVDVFAVKLSPGGAHLWSRRFGGPGDEYANAVVADASQNVFVVGRFDTSIDFGPGPISTAGGTDAFVVRLNGGDGSRMVDRTFGGPGDDDALGVATDGSDVIVCGQFQDTVDFGAGDVSATGDTEAFVSRYWFNMTHEWTATSTTSAGNVVRCRAAAVDAADHTFVVGDATAAVQWGTQNLTHSGGTDAFAVNISPTGGIVAAKRWGDSGDESAAGLVIVPPDDVVIVGDFENLVSFGGAGLQAAQSDVFILRASAADFSHVWSRDFGGNGDDHGTGVARTVDSLFVVGTFDEEIAYDESTFLPAGGVDAFVVEVDSTTGAYVWGNGIGGVADDAALGVGTGLSDQVSVIGSFHDAVDFGRGVVSTEGADDIFVIKYAP